MHDDPTQPTDGVSPNAAEYAAEPTDADVASPQPDTMSRQVIDITRASLPPEYRADYRDPTAPAVPAGRRMLSRSEILRKGSSIPQQWVDVPEWSEAGEPAGVIVRGLDAYMRDQWEMSMYQIRGRESVLHIENVRARLCAWTIVDENGLRIFSDDDIEDLGRMEPRGLDRVFVVARKLSGLTQEDINEIVGKSPATPNANSNSA